MGRPNLEYDPEVIREFASVFLVSRDHAGIRGGDTGAVSTVGYLTQNAVVLTYFIFWKGST